MDTAPKAHFAVRMIVATTLSAGCFDAMARDQADVRPLLEAAPSISFVYYTAPPLYVMTPAKVAGAGLMAAATHSEQLPSGGELEKAFAIPDASGEIAAQLAARMMTPTLAPKLHVEDHPHGRAWSRDPGVYHGETQDPFVLELFVDGKAANYLPLKWRTYYFGLSVQLRLIDVAQSKVIWQHHCNQSGLHGDTYKLKVDQFEANGGARLKEVTRAANDFCAHELGELLAGS
jgi:hypothetical protein